MTRRNDKEVLAAQAAQVVDNPAFRQAFDRQRDAIISKLETLELDGGSESNFAALENVRALQAAIGFKREFKRMIASGLREARRQDEKAKPQPFDPTETKK